MSAGTAVTLTKTSGTPKTEPPDLARFAIWLPNARTSPVQHGERAGVHPGGRAAGPSGAFWRG